MNVLDPEEIRRLIAWVLCDAMPPDDAALRKIYADDVALDALGAGLDERALIRNNVHEKFDILIPFAAIHAGGWSNVGDVIRCVQSANVDRELVIT